MMERSIRSMSMVAERFSARRIATARSRRPEAPKRLSRKDKRAAAGLVAGLLAAGAASGADADLVLRGGAVYTLDEQRSRAQAIAVDDGRIVAVGTDAELARFVGAATEVVDLGGRMVLPGFHDAHAHPIAGGMDALACSLVDARSVEAILARVRECASSGDDGEWLVGAGWDLSLFPAANPHRSLLDAIESDRPILLGGADGHSAWVNSKALALAGIDRSTPDPPKGVIERDATTGEPSGTLRESATSLVARLVPEPTDDARRAGLRHALRLAASLGITSVIDPVVSGADRRVYEAADAAGELTVRVLACEQPEELAVDYAGIGGDGGAAVEGPHAAPTDSSAGAGAAARREAAALPPGAARDHQARPRVRTGCLKIFVDGVLEGETAALLEPYHGPRRHRGTLHVEPAALAEAVTRYDARGIQVHLHTIGDRAVRVALDAVEAARRANGPGDARHHLAHLQLVHPDDHPRFAALDVTATFQALWAYPDSYIEGINLAQVGRERVDRMYPIGSLGRAGARIAGGSDWPVTSLDPLLAIEVALTRQDPAGGDADVLNAGERVDLDTLLAAYTRNGAWLMRQEAETGSIAVGKAADLVVLERDLFALPPDEVGEVRVVRTIVDGETVYRAPD